MASVSQILTLSTEGLDAESLQPDAEKVISGNPEQRLWNRYSSADNHFHTGIWDCQAGEWEVNYSEHEVCIILEGESVIHDHSGESRTVRAGDQFVIPAGFRGRWEVPVYCKKIYVIYEA